MTSFNKSRLAIGSLLAILLLCASHNAHAELSSEALRFRNSINTFLKEEGYMPNLSEDGLSFKSEGTKYWMTISGESPVRIEFHITGYEIKDTDPIAVLYACNEVNNTKFYVKAFADKFTDDGSVSIAIEMPCHSAEEFKYVFYDCMKALQSSRTMFQDEYNSFTSDDQEKLDITSCSVANVEKDTSIITDFGNTIYSSRTKYIQPRLDINCTEPGTYTICYKFIQPNGDMSTGDNSPSGYSNSDTVTLKKGSNTVTLSGWGRDTAGNWGPGEYKLDFYCDGESLGFYRFTIY